MTVTAPAPLQQLSRWARGQAEAYRSDTEEQRPLGGYIAALTTYGASVAALTAAAVRAKRSGPDVGPWDVVLLGAATHRLARTIAKDAVATPLRAPFVQYEGAAGEGEVTEQVRHHGGLSHAVGELVTCPFCLAQWVATGFVAGSVFVPRFTRLATTTMTAVALADFLQLGYAALQRLAEG